LISGRRSKQTNLGSRAGKPKIKNWLPAKCEHLFPLETLEKTKSYEIHAFLLPGFKNRKLTFASHR
jgi:hypothetical protein